MSGCAWSHVCVSALAREWPQAGSLGHGKEKLWLFLVWMVSVFLYIKDICSLWFAYIVSVVKTLFTLMCGLTFSHKTSCYGKCWLMQLCHILLSLFLLFWLNGFVKYKKCCSLWRNQRDLCCCSVELFNVFVLVLWSITFTVLVWIFFSQELAWPKTK